jgi:autotransporter-associated beta strand protein
MVALSSIALAVFSLLIFSAIAIYPYTKARATLEAVGSIDGQFTSDTSPTFTIKTAGLIKSNDQKVAQGKLDIGYSSISANAVWAQETAGIPAQITAVGGSNNDQFEIKVNENQFRPGKYQIVIKLSSFGREQNLAEDFTWGVLAINSDKSVYKLGETAYLQMGVLDDLGHTLCSAPLKLEVQSPSSVTQTLLFSAGSIQKSGDCGQDNVTDKPDYFANYKVSELGEYQLKLTNLSNNYTIRSSFKVEDLPIFDVERVGASRINPFKASYNMTMKVKSTQDFNGSIREVVPASFAVGGISSGGVKSQNSAGQIIVWPEVLAAGQEVELSYTYQAPQISPEFYLLGPLEFYRTTVDSDNGGATGEALVFKEARRWQLASDSSVVSWTGSVSAYWSNGANWSTGSVPSAGDNLLFPNGASNKSTINDLGENYLFDSITLNDSGYALSGNTIIIGQGLAGVTDAVASGGNTISLNLRFDATRWITVSGSSETLTISGTIAGIGGVTKEGLGDLVLAGANTYGGVTKVNVGSLIAQNNTALGTIVGGTEVVGEADLELKGNITIGREPLTLRGYGVSSGGALKNLQDNNSFAGLITLVQTTEIDSDSGTLTLSGGTTGAFNLNLDGASDINFTTAPIAIGGGLLTKNGGGTTTFSFPNTLTGLVTVNAGKLLYGCDNALLSSPLTVNGGILDMATYSDMVGTVTLGTLAGGTGVITGTSGILSGTSYVVYAGTISAIIAGDGSTLAKSTPGTVILTRPNQFSGAVTLTVGTLVIRDSLALGVIDGNTTVSSGATLQVDGNGNDLTVPEYINISGLVLKNAGALANTTGNNTITGQITLGAAATIETSASTTLTIATGGVIGATLGLTIDGDGNTTFSTGPIATTTGTLTKNGNGTLTISTYCPYSGATTINDGILTLNNSGSINLSTVLTIATHGTLTVDNGGAQVDRLADTAAISDAGGDFNFNGSSSGNIMETAGVLTFGAGQSAINITTSSSGSTVLRFASLVRTAGASAIVRGASLGSTPGPNIATLLFSTAPVLFGDDGAAGSPTVSTLQGVFGDDSTSGTGTDMVTYGRGNNNGLRLLNHAGFSNEYTADLTMTNANVRLSVVAAAITTQIGSLTLDPGARIFDTGSAKTMTLVSGNILNLASGTSIDGANTTLAGGTAGNTEFIIRVPLDLTISANITTSGGLSKSGLGTLTYSTVKGYTGLTAVNSGTLLYGVDNAISSGAVTVDSATLDMATFSDTVGVVTCQGGTITSDGASSGTLTGTSYSFRDSMISAVLGGVGAVNIVNTGANVDAVTTMTRDNTLSGPITVTTGILKLGGNGGSTNTPLGTVAGATTVASGGMLDLNGFNLGTAEPITINGTGTALQGAIINSSATPVTYSGAVTLGATAPRIGADYSKITMSGAISGTVVLTVGGFNNIDLTGALSSTMGVTKDGFGTFSPTNSGSSYSGVTTVNAGTLQLGADGGGTNTPLGTSAGATSITQGATFDLNGHSFAGSAEPLTLNGLGSGTGDFAAGALINSSASAATWNGVITNGTATIKANAGSINLTGATMAGTVALTLGGSGTGTVASALASGAASIVKIDPGTWTLSGLSLYTGVTTIYQGTIKLGASDTTTPSGPLGTAGSGTTIYSGGVLNLNSFSLGNLAEALGINGFGINGAGAVVNNSSVGVTYLGGRTLSSDSRVTNSGTGLLTLSGAQAGAYESRFGGDGNITMSGATAATASSLLKDGAGTMTLSAANSHSGATTVNAGTLKEGITSSLNAGNLVLNGGTFDMNSYSDTIGALIMTDGTLASTGGGVLTTTGSTVESGTISGIIAGAVTLTKNTAGTLNISGAETYSGATTINAGTISLGGSGTAVSSAFTINLGGTLKLDNSISNLANRLGDTLAVTMNGGNFYIIGQDSTTVTETIGQLAFLTGHNTVTIDPKAGSGGLGTTLTVANATCLSRTAGSTALFRGTSFGSTPAAGISSLICSTPPTLSGGGGAANSKTISIIKGAFGDGSLTGTGSDMVTYNVGNTTGLRLLNGAGYTTEYQGDLSVASANVKLTGNTAATATNTNSLILNNYNVTNASVTMPMANGTSLAGNILMNSANAIGGANTVIGITTNELDILATANGSIPATIGTATSGLMALSGSGSVTFSGTNLYTGITYVNGATFTYGASNVLAVSTVNAVGGTFDLNGNSDTINGLTLTAGTVKTGGGTLTVSTDIASVANANLSSTINGNLALGGNRIFNVAEGLVEDDLVVKAVISGANTLTKSTGLGVLVLSAANSYSGLTTIANGTIKLGGVGDATNTPLGTTAGATTVSSGAALDLNGYTLTANPADALTINGTGLAVKGAILNTTSTSVSYNGLITLGSAATIESDYGDINITNTGTITGATLALTLRGAGNGSLASIVGTTSGSIVKNDMGTWTLSGASTYTGVTTIILGVIKLGATGGSGNSPLGTTGANTTIASTAMLDLNGFTLATAEPLSINGVGINNAGAVTTSSGNDTSFSGPITLATASRIANFGSGTFSISGALAGAYQLTLVSAPGTITQSSTSAWANVNGGFTKEGQGLAILAGQNQYTGAVTVSTGTLQIGANGGATYTPLGTIAGGVTVSAGAVLDLSTYVVGGASAWEPLTLNGSGINNGGALISSASGGNSFGALSLASACRIINSGSGIINITGAVTTASNLIVGGTGPTTISGLLTTAGITLTKYDAGTLILSNAANANTGLMRVNGGTLQLSGSGSIAVTPVTVAGGTFDFNGITKTIGAVTLISGTITDSNGSAGILSGTSYAFYGGSISGVLGGSAIAMAKTTGATLTVNKSMTDTGLLTIYAGTVQYLASNVIADSASVTVAGGTLDIQGNSDTFATLTLTSGYVTGGGTITGTASPAYAVASGSISSILAGAVNLTKTTVGLVTLSGVNTYTGITNISAGTLSVGTIGDGGSPGNLGAAGNGAVNLVSSANGTLQYTGVDSSTNRNITTNTGIALQIDITNPATALTISGATTSSTALLNKIGPGTLILSGANLHTGVTSVLAGTLKYGADNTILTGAVTVNNGTYDINNHSDSVGTIILQNGGQIVDSGGSTAVLTSTAQFDFRSGKVTARLGSAVAAGLAKTTTDRVILSADNTFTCTSITLSNGALNLQHNNAMGASGTTLTTTITAGAVLEMQNNITTPSTKLITVSGTGVNQGGAIRNAADSNTIAAAVTLGATGVRINAYSGTLNINGAMSGATFGVTFGGAGNIVYGGAIGTTSGTLTKDGMGTLTLSVGNSYTGATVVNAGVVVANNATSFGTIAGGVNVASGASAQLQNSITVGNEALTLNGTGVSSDGALRSTTGTNIWQGAVTLGSTSAIGVDAGTLTLSGTITGSGSNGLTKVGGAALTVAATTVGGDLNISAGTLTVSGANNVILSGNLIIGSSGQYFKSSGTFTFNGSGSPHTWTDNSGGQDLGSVVINGTSLTVNLASAVRASSINIYSGQGLSANGPNSITLSGNWTNAGTFTASTGTVYLNGAGGSTQIVSGSTTFNNLSATATLARTINFDANTVSSAVTTVTGTWTCTGAASQQITLGRNGGSGSDRWFINPTAWSVDYVTPANSNNQASAAINPIHYTDGGNNNNWIIIGNAAPTTPASLVQKKVTGGATLNTGDWTNENQLQFTATTTDADVGDTEYLCVEVKPTATALPSINGGTQCGSGVANSSPGNPVAITVTVTGLTDATEYHWQVQAKDAAAAYSSFATYGSNTENPPTNPAARDFGVDTTGPTGGTVNDGIGADISYNDGSLSTLSANWSGIDATASGLSKYEYAIGTTAGATDTKAWTNNTTNTSVTDSSLSLHTGQTYFFSVRTTDNAGNLSAPISSSGQAVAPTLSFSYLSGAAITFNELNAGNLFTDSSKSTVLRTSTNAYSGYVIKAYTTDKLRKSISEYIADFASSNAAPAVWSGTGFGYTTSDSNLSGGIADRFTNGGPKYAGFTQTTSGDPVADHTASVSGLPISNEDFTINYRVTGDALTTAGKYSTTIVYTCIPQY